MISKSIWIGISIGVFFAGFGISYAIFASTYDPATMKFRNQDLFDQMMSNNPKMTATWMDSAMMNDPAMQQEMMMKMMQNMDMHEEIMHEMMQDYETREHMMGHMMADEELMKNMGIILPAELGSKIHDVPKESMMSSMMFNTNVPITIPMIDAYYNDYRIYFVHTEVSDKQMSQMMTEMVNFPTLYVPELASIPQDKLAKVYVFTNGVSGMGPYGGGPFMYQIDIFDSIPENDGYSQFRVPHLVTWNEEATPRVLTSVEQLLEAEKNGEVTIQPTQNVVNAPVIVWKSDDQKQTATMISQIFESMPDVEGEVVMADTELYIARMNLHVMDKMNMEMMK